MARIPFVLTLGLLLLFACNDPSTLGGEILPPDDDVSLIFTDTVTLRSSTVERDSVLVKLPAPLLTYPVGQVEDGVFGKARSELYATFTPTAINPNFENAVFDSLVLSFALDTNFVNIGQRDALQNFSVYRIEEDLDVLELYYSNRTFQTGAKIGEIVNTPIDMETRPRVITNGTLADDDRGSFDGMETNFSEVSIDTLTEAPQLRILLDNSIGMEIFDLYANADSSITPTDFTNAFKGIHLVPDDGNSTIFRLNFNAPESQLVMHYSIPDTITIMDTVTVGNDLEITTSFEEVILPKSFPFIATSQTPRSLNFTNDYTGAEVEPFINQTIDHPDSLVFIQALQGLDAVVTFPFLDSFQGNIINQAELVLTVADTSDIEAFPLPPRLIATSLDEGSGTFFVLEESLFEGTPEMETDGSTFYYRYTLNLTIYLQEILNGSAANQIFISIGDSDDRVFASVDPSRAENASHVILGGSNNSRYGMKLNLTFTKL